MTRRRWIADEVSGNIAALVGEHAAHLARVLRAQVGQEFDIAVGESVRRGTIVSISPERVEFALGEEVSGGVNAIELSLVLAVFKFDRMEWAIEKCTEVGVSRIIPVIARRTDAHLASTAAKRHERWERIARSASEQSRRIAPPEILAPVKLRELLTSSQSWPTGRVVLSESENDLRLRDALNAAGDRVALAVGPEGGWADDELAGFRDSGWKMASLGPTILRAETAATVGAAIALELMR